ncbi:MAG: T9SS type A sorting domain-containing protein [Bacteroidetes bacterium]|nr:T9SS type A sorting domain-containing protein [Bacteroidota bacterium]
MKQNKILILFLFSINTLLFSQSLNLISPNGGEIWEHKSSPKIIWTSDKVSLIRIDISFNDGVDWENISLIWPSAAREYTWYVPDSISSECKIKITDTSNDSVYAMSSNSFTIREQSESKFILVLGSSTAAGVGVTTNDSAWVTRYKKYVQQRNTAVNVINLAVGGYTTYEILPNGYVTPANRPSPAIGHNITKALSYSPIAIIINLPSNDAAYNYSVEEQLFNYSVVMNKADSANVPVWVATTQPRNLTDIQRQSLMDVRDSTYSIWGDSAIDFWSTIADESGKIVSTYGSGDGIHLNNAGHRILFNRVVNENIPITITSTNDIIAYQPTSFKLEQNFPNPFNPATKIQYNLQESGFVKLIVYNTLGQEVETIVDNFENAGLHSTTFNAQNLSSGFYFYTLQVGTHRESKKMMLLK